MSWPDIDPAVKDRVRIFVLTGYTGSVRVGELLRAERFPTPAEVKYGIKVPKCRWNRSTVERLIARLSFAPPPRGESEERENEMRRGAGGGVSGIPWPDPNTLSVGATRRILRFFRDRPPRPNEVDLQHWLVHVRQHFEAICSTECDRQLLAQPTSLFDQIS